MTTDRTDGRSNFLLSPSHRLSLAATQRRWWAGLRAAPRGGVIAVVLITLIGLAVRAWGANYSVPYSTYADEPVVMLYALQDGARLMGQAPARPSYPQAYTTALLLGYGGYYVVGRALGDLQSANDLVRLYVADPTVLMLIGRILSAIMGALAIPFMYGAAARLFNRRVGMLAAALIAVNYFLVYYGHVAVVDAMVSMTACLALLFIVRVYHSEHWGNYVAAGLAIGLGIATKITPAVLAFSLVAAHLLRADSAHRLFIRRLFDRRLILAALFVAIGVGAFWPDLLLDPARFQQGLGSYTVGQMPMDGSGLWRLIAAGDPYWTETAAEPMSIMIQSLRLMGDWPLILSVVSVVYGLLVFRRHWLVVMTGPAIFYLALGITGYPHLRQIGLVVPFLMLMLAAALDAVAVRVTARSPRNQRAVFLGLSALTLVPMTLATVQLDLALTKPGTLPTAAAWLRDNVSAGSVVALDPMYTPFHQFTAAAVEAGGGSGTNVLRQALIDNAPDYGLLSTVETEPGEQFGSLYERLIQRRVSIVVVADYFFRRYHEEIPPSRGTSDRLVWDQRLALYDEVAAKAELVTTFEPKVYGVGPLLKVYRLPATP